MSFTIRRKLEQVPSHATLCKLAEQNHIRITGDERTGSFSGRGVAGDYQLGDDGSQGTFAGHGVTGKFSLTPGEVAVTITGKPFWLPETLLRQRLADGLDRFCNDLATPQSA